MLIGKIEQKTIKTMYSDNDTIVYQLSIIIFVSSF
jgi:hypothetical protein